MKKTVILISLLIIFSIFSCTANTGPISQEGTPTQAMKSIAPLIGETFLWVKITPGADKSTILVQFGDSTTAKGTGETIIYDGTITDIFPTDQNNTNTYAFQTGTVTGSLEILDKTRVKINFTQNVSPYTTIMQAICEGKEAGPPPGP